MGLKELVRKHVDQYLEQLDGEIPQGSGQCRPSPSAGSSILSLVGTVQSNTHSSTSAPLHESRWSRSMLHGVTGD